MAPNTAARPHLSDESGCSGDKDAPLGIELSDWCRHVSLSLSRQSKCE